MTQVILAFVFVLSGIGLWSYKPAERSQFSQVRVHIWGPIACFALAFFLLLSTSFVSIESDERGHLKRIYAGSDLPPGRIIAMDGEKGPQAGLISPGFHLMPLVNVINNVEPLPVIDVPDGKYVAFTARDGSPLPSGQTYASPLPTEMFKKMLSDGEYALTKGGLQMGPQTTVLGPGKYGYNHYLYSRVIGNVYEVHKGFVAVIKSNVWGPANIGNLIADREPEDCKPVNSGAGLDGELAVPLVPVGCVGIWNVALGPGKYYFNQQAYVPLMIETRLVTWEYKGGYTKRTVNLTIDQDGQIKQSPEQTEEILVPEDAADAAVMVRVEGWNVPLELRALVQVTPENAPFVVASVGGLEEVENRVLTPTIRSVVRNVGGSIVHVKEPVLDTDKKPVLNENGEPKMISVARPTRALDFIENREILEGEVEQVVKTEGQKARVDIREVRFGEPALPPEVLIPRQRQQLAYELRTSFQQEKIAQDERIKTEQARATANQQGDLVKAQISQLASVQTALAKENEGRGEKQRLVLIAEGQREQAGVLGQDRVVELRKYEVLLDRVFGFLNEHSDVLTTALSNAHKFVPDRVFTIGAGGEANGHGLAGPAAILGDFLGGGTRLNAPDQAIQKK